MEMPKQDMDAFERVVLAGMKLMYDKSTFKIFQSGMMKEDIPLPKRLAVEAAGLMKMLMEKSGGKIPPQIIVPAATMLMMEMGKFMSEAGVAEPTSEEMREASGILLKLLEALFVDGKQPSAPGQAEPPAAEAPAPEAQPQAPPPAPPAAQQTGGGLLTQPLGA